MIYKFKIFELNWDKWKFGKYCKYYSYALFNYRICLINVVLSDFIIAWIS